jgi:hypothetical protein
MATIIQRDDGLVVTFGTDELEAGGPQIPIVVTKRTKVLIPELRRFKGPALISTALPRTLIDSDMLVELGLKSVGAVEAWLPGRQEAIMAPSYNVSLFMQHGLHRDLTVLAMPLSPVRVVLGRDFLRAVRLEYDGKLGAIKLS